jgi:hypothetical protein
MQSQNTQASFIRRGVKATVGQLDRWESDQPALQQRRELANSRFPHGVKDRLALARHRAGSGKNGPPCCDFCDASGHSSDSCQVTKEVPAASLTCPDCFALSVDCAVEDFKASSGVTPSGTRQQQSNGLSTVQLCHSREQNTWEKHAGVRRMRSALSLSG